MLGPGYDDDLDLECLAETCLFERDQESRPSTVDDVDRSAAPPTSPGPAGPAGCRYTSPMRRAPLTVGIGLTLACGTSSPDSPPPPTVCPEVAAPPPVTADAPVSPAGPTELSAPLEGPISDLDALVAGRVQPLSEDCGPPSEDFPRSEVRATSSGELPGPALEYRLMRYPGDIACAPIEFCMLAIRTATGWWVSKHDDSHWCHGITGLSSRVTMEDDEVTADEARPGVVAHVGFRVTASREYGTKKHGKEERWTETRTPFARLCEVTADDRVHCQAQAPLPVW